MAKKKEEDKKQDDSESLVKEEKTEEKKEDDYNSIFDDDFVEEEKKETEGKKDTEEGEIEGETTSQVDEETEDEAEMSEATSTLIEENESEETPREESKSKDKPKSKNSNKENQKKPETEVKEDKEIEESKEAEAQTIKVPKQKKQRGFSAKKILIPLAIVFALFLGALGGYFYFKTANKPKEETKSPETKTEEPAKASVAKTEVYITAEDGLNMRKEPDSKSEVLTVIPYGTKLEVLEEKDSWYKVLYKEKTGWISQEFATTKSPLVYQNNKYGFELTFPSKWSTYKIVEKNVNSGDGTTSPVLYVGIKVSDTASESTVGKGYADMFAISVLTEKQWNDEQAGEGGSKSTLITKSGDKVFTWSPSQAGTDEVSDERDEMADILKTFKIL